MGTFYNQDRRWRQKREAILRRDRYIDQLELRAGKYIEADTVHHILPIEIYPEYRWEDWNLISLSRRSHELLHNRITGGLSKEGDMLMREVADKQGIKLNELTLVIGKPNSGKTTWVKMHIGDGLCYDLDYIASAFRLRSPNGAEEHKGARRMANSMVKAFAHNVARYASRAFVIRTAPSLEELEAIDPDRVVVVERDASPRQKHISVQELQRIAEDIEHIQAFCEANKIPCEMVKISTNAQGL